MSGVWQTTIRALGALLMCVVLIACGDGTESHAGQTGGGSALRAAGGPVDSEAAAIAAVRGHLTAVTACRSALQRLEQDFDRGRFGARLVTTYSFQSPQPVWEVAVASEQHIPYLIWFVEQSDGTVLASISAATYYESPLIQMCRPV